MNTKITRRSYSRNYLKIVNKYIINTIRDKIGLLQVEAF